MPKPQLSTDILNSDFEKPFVKKWLRKLHISPKVKHAKYWQQAMISEALDEAGCLKPGKRGIGFGVGTEQLVSLFASTGAHVTATDQAPEDDALAWDNGQLAQGKKSLYKSKIIKKDKFEKNVSFQHHDMNTFEPAFEDVYDFAWSNCVIGHLGSMQQSEDYLERHAKYIKYGGVSIVTTELNISSITHTVDRDSGTIIWRLDDLQRVFTKMLDHDMVADRFKLRLAQDDSDKEIFFDIDDVKPGNIHKLDNQFYITKVPFSNYAITQIQIIFRKRKISSIEKRARRHMYALDTKRNLQKLKRFIAGSGDITDYATTYTGDEKVTNLTKKSRITLSPGQTKKVILKFRNDGPAKLFSYGLHTPLNVPPLVLATASPVNRDSVFASDDWFSGNRPSVEFSPPDASLQHGKHRSLPGETFTYDLILKAPKKKGTYEEDFCLILEGSHDLPETKLSLTIDVR